MNMQTKASFKKESLSFFRTGRFFIIAAAIFGLALFMPLLIAGLTSFMDAASDIYYDMGMDVTDMTDFLATSSAALANSTTSISQIGLLVLIILLNRAAGGEQKKRTIIIPQNSGLRSFSYLFPKYIIYPVSAFVLGFLSMLASFGISTLLFDVNDVLFQNFVFSALLIGATLAFYVSLHLTLGTATGQAGLSAALCLVAAFLLPTVFSVAGGEVVFNPFGMDLFALNTMTGDALTGTQMLDVLFTILFALGIMVVAFLVALFAQNAKKIDNSGDEKDL